MIHTHPLIFFPPSAATQISNIRVYTPNSPLTPRFYQAPVHCWTVSKQTLNRPTTSTISRYRLEHATELGNHQVNHLDASNEYFYLDQIGCEKLLFTQNIYRIRELPFEDAAQLSHGCPVLSPCCSSTPLLFSQLYTSAVFSFCFHTKTH
jgi:hypothetical protein